MHYILVRSKSGGVEKTEPDSSWKCTMKGQEVTDTTCNEDTSTGNEKPLHEEEQHWMPRISFLTVFKMQLDGAEQRALTRQAAGGEASMATCSLRDPQDTPERRRS